MRPSKAKEKQNKMASTFTLLEQLIESLSKGKRK